MLPSGSRSVLQGLLQLNGTAHQVSALNDSGAEGDFMDTELFRPVPLAEPISARTLCGTHLTRITHFTKFITLMLSVNHAEEICFLIHSSSAPVVLGHTWLVKHNPHIDWALNSVLEWSPFCLS